MLQKAVEQWELNKAQIEAKFKESHPSSYRQIVECVIEAITGEDYEDFSPDPARIHEIDDGDYQGTLLYVISSKGYQPSDYYFVKVGYGSCSGCDTLQAICGYTDGPPTTDQVAQYMLLALHIVQGLKELGGEVV